MRPIFGDESSAAFDFDNTIINLLSSQAAGELIEPGVVAEPDAGSRFQLTIWVDDADAACEEFKARGVELLNGPYGQGMGSAYRLFRRPRGTRLGDRTELDLPEDGVDTRYPLLDFRGRLPLTPRR